MKGCTYTDNDEYKSDHPVQAVYQTSITLPQCVVAHIQTGRTNALKPASDRRQEQQKRYAKEQIQYRKCRRPEPFHENHKDVYDDQGDPQKVCELDLSLNNSI